MADGGTLFLDELGEINPNMQAKLLRVLESGGFRPVGGHRLKKPDIRIIGATNRDLSDLVKKGAMREDFFYGSISYPSSCRRCATARKTSPC